MRTVLDDELREWEAWAVPGRGGVPAPAAITFRCLTDGHERPRAVAIPEGRTEAELRLQRASDDELRELFEHAEPIR